MALCSGFGMGIGIGVVGIVAVATPLRLSLPLPLRTICRSPSCSSRGTRTSTSSTSRFHDAPFGRRGGRRGDRTSPSLTPSPSHGPFSVPTLEESSSIRHSSSSGGGSVHATTPARRNYDNIRNEGGGGGDLEEGCGKTPISNSRRLILYSKPGCCLCDGLKEKLADGDTLTEIHLEVRDITANADWWKSYQYEIPVLARVREDDTEVLLPRFSPRLNADQVQKKIFALMTAVD